jgi:hypothetical protein
MDKRAPRLEHGRRLPADRVRLRSRFSSAANCGASACAWLQVHQQWEGAGTGMPKA